MRVQLVIRRLQVRPLPGPAHSFVETEHEISKMSILLIQEGQMQVSGRRKRTSTG